MADASEAGRLLSRRRWGDQRVRTLVGELLDRIAEVDVETADLLRARLDESRQRRAEAAR